MKRKKVLVLIAALIALLYWFWPRPLQRVLSEKLNRLCEAATLTTALAPLEARFKAKELSNSLAPTVYLHYRSPEEEFTRTLKRSEALDAVSAGLTRVQTLKVVFSNFKVVRESGDSVEVSLFVIAEWKLTGDVETNRAAEDTRLWFEYLDGAWKIARIETLPRFTVP